MLNTAHIQAISLDLDDTLWPVWPAIERAEATLLQWLADHAPATQARYPTTLALRAVREQLERERPDLLHDLSTLRRESIRLALRHPAAFACAGAGRAVRFSWCQIGLLRLYQLRW
jgi:FMN phosphatase YigB (HAD superfamily)